jgi:hypothetical protein
MKFDRFKVEDGKEYIYLVMVEYKDKTLLKIGYTKTIEGRMDTYELHNPDIQLLKIREGSRSLENYMHKRFKKYAYPKREEWFYYNEEIFNGFDTLEETNFLDVDRLKDRVYNLLKPKSIGELKKKYYEKYKDEEIEGVDKKELDTVISDTIYILNEKIVEFIRSLDYSNVPSEIVPNVNYNVSIPNLIFPENLSMGLEQILGKPRDNSGKKISSIQIIRPDELKNIREEFEERLNYKIKNTKNIIRVLGYTSSEYKPDIINLCIRVKEYYCYFDDYISINKSEQDELVPFYNESIMKAEARIIDVYIDDYKDRFSAFSTI